MSCTFNECAWVLSQILQEMRVQMYMPLQKRTAYLRTSGGDARANQHKGGESMSEIKSEIFWKHPLQQVYFVALE